MSTKSTTHFIYGNKKKPLAIVYRHSNGYPEGAGADIYKFLLDVKAQVPNDTRFDDPSYLAAKYVVWLARKFAYDWVQRDPEKNNKSGFVSHADERPLDFRSVGVMMSDPGDIEYRYIIDCGNIDQDGLPDVTCQSADRKKTYGIPRPVEEGKDDDAK